MEQNHPTTTSAVDLLAASDRFLSSSRLRGRLQRWHLLWRKSWWVVALVMLVVLGAIYYVTAEMPRMYRSQARMWLTGRLSLSESRLYTEELIDYQATQAELLRSSTIQRRALARLRPLFTNDFSASAAAGVNHGPGLVHNLKAWVNSLTGRTVPSTEQLEESIPFSLKVTESSKSSTLELRATGTEPAATRAFLNCVMDEYFAFKRETRQKGSDRTLASVTSEAHRLEEELKAQREKLYDFQSSNNVVFLQEQGNSAGSYLAELNRRIAAMRTQLRLLERLEPEQWIEVESGRRGGSGGESSDATAAEVLASLAGPQADLFRARQQAELLKAKREELSRFLRPLHPKIVKLNEEVATQEKLVRLCQDEALRQLATRRQALQLELKNLESAFAEWDLKAIQASRKIADYDRLRLDLQRLQAADDRLLGVIQTVDVSKTVDQENVGVLEPASVAKPVPRMAVNMLLGLALASVLSLAALYCLGLLDDRFASPFEVVNCLSEEVLGEIPAIALKPPRGHLGIQFLERQRSDFLESFRNLRSALWFMHNGQARPKSILITSSLPDEGKSTVAFYLAATMAIANLRVLLIDADMRRGCVHKFFSVARGPGLGEILSETNPSTGAIIPSSLKNLFLLPAGVARRNPGELVLSSEWTRLLKELGPRFDYILIDSPPLLATDDAASLAPKVDGVLMIVRGSFTSATMARRGLDLLRQRHARVLGLVFNRATASSNGYHGYKRYRREYRWRAPLSKQLAAG